MLIRRTRTGVADERGVVIVVVMAVMLFLGLISAAVLASAVANKNASATDRSGKQAYGVALAGLRTGIYWLNTSTPDDGQCPPYPGTSTQISPNAANVCGPYESDNASALGTTTQPIVNGRFTYWITPVLDTSATSTNNDICTGAPPRVATSRHIDLVDRCITALGEAYANGTTRVIARRRIQARLSSGQFLFPIPGVWGTSCVTINYNNAPTGGGCDSHPLGATSAAYLGSIGSNGPIIASMGAWYDDPAGPAVSPCFGNCPANLYLGWRSPTDPTLPQYSIKLGGSAPGIIPGPTGCTGGALTYCNASTPPLPWPNNVPIQFGRYFTPPRSHDALFANPPPPHFPAAAPGCTGTGTDIATCNNNPLLAAAIAAAPCTGTAIDAATRSLTVGTGCTLRVPNGSYDFCNITLGESSKVLPANADPTTAEVRFFVDNNIKQRATISGCTGSSNGNFTVGGASSTAATWMTNAAPNPSGGASNCPSQFAGDPWSPRAGELFAFGAGDPDDPTTNYPPNIGRSIDLPSGMIFNGLIEAPNNTLNVTGSGACIKGGLAAGAVNIAGNAGFLWDAVSDDVVPKTVPTFYRIAWANCGVSNFNASFPMDGC
jgi:Tfp pilus assembly protein PilX